MKKGLESPFVNFEAYSVASLGLSGNTFYDSPVGSRVRLNPPTPILGGYSRLF